MKRELGGGVWSETIIHANAMSAGRIGETGEVALKLERDDETGKVILVIEPRGMLYDAECYDTPMRVLVHHPKALETFAYALVLLSKDPRAAEMLATCQAIPSES